MPPPLKSFSYCLPSPPGIVILSFFNFIKCFTALASNYIKINVVAITKINSVHKFKISVVY